MLSIAGPKLHELIFAVTPTSELNGDVQELTGVVSGNDNADYVTLTDLAAMSTSRCPPSRERCVAFLARVMEVRHGNHHGL